MMMATAKRQPVGASTSAFSDFLRSVMARHKCTTIADLARLTGVDQSALSRYLNTQSEPTLDNLRKIGAAVGIRLGDLMVAAGMATRAELGLVPGPPPRKIAPELRRAQDFIEHPATSSRARRWMLKGVEGLVEMGIENRDGIPHEPSAAERGR